MDNFCGYSAVFKAYDKAFPVKPVAMNVLFDADCVVLFDDNSLRCLVYAVDARNRF